MKPTLKPPLSCLITCGDAKPQNFNSKKTEILNTVERAARASVPMVQIREKSLTTKQLFELVREAVVAISGTETMILVNERFDVAVAAGAAGVHLPSYSLGPEIVRCAGLHDLIIGVSGHSLDEVRQASEHGADYTFLAPIFASPGKPKPLGLEILRNACEVVSPFPVLALGGVDGSNVGAVLAAGAAGFAAIRFLNSRGGLDAWSEMRNETY